MLKCANMLIKVEADHAFHWKENIKITTYPGLFAPRIKISTYPQPQLLKWNREHYEDLIAQFTLYDENENNQINLENLIPIIRKLCK